MPDQRFGSAALSSPAPVYRIIPARPQDVQPLPAIELAAARLFVGHASETVLTQTTSQEDHEEAQRHGLLWAALFDDAPVGFAHVDLLEPGSAHLEELDVHPDHGRRGLGTRLVMVVCQWAASEGFLTVTLTTYRDVSWNMPFYARLGFEEIPPADISPALVSRMEDEARRGVDPAKRVAMQRRCAVPDQSNSAIRSETRR